MSSVLVQADLLSPGAPGVHVCVCIYSMCVYVCIAGVLVKEHVLWIVLVGMENLLEAGGRSSPHRFHGGGANLY